MYADDTAIVCTGDNSQDILNTLANELEAAHLWLSEHKLTLNLKKTKVMLFGTNHTLSGARENHLDFAGEQVEIVNSYKYLGIMMDSRLRYDKM